MSIEDNKASDSFESDVQKTEHQITDTNAQYELIDQEDFLIIEALSILKKRAKKYGEVFSSVKDSALYFMLDLADLEKEVFKVAYLNNRHQLIKTETVAIGTIDSATVSIREIAKLALQHNSCAIALAHNHPSGNTQPSHSDIEFTKRVITALNVFEVRVLDHLIVTNDEYYSMREQQDVDFEPEKTGSQKLS